MSKQRESLESDGNTLCYGSGSVVDVVGWLLARLQSASVYDFKIDGLSFSWPVVEVFREQGEFHSDAARSRFP